MDGIVLLTVVPPATFLFDGQKQLKDRPILSPLRLVPVFGMQKRQLRAFNNVSFSQMKDNTTNKIIKMTIALLPFSYLLRKGQTHGGDPISL